ncbi:hypothetical protein IU443_04415 [Nocardia farcinica]|uniref:Uncharacterized protein n=2 Tax=Nocardia farcinica TaxID=37329 RepID=Q5YX06_NOCFA|nr:MULTISPECIES: hypothetical protein [Nocardia]SLH85586.1 transmembrane protein [Mycobacteroides abscessus subsp. abscessus]AXK85037.1 hypothetical protein DXT66_04780 [Nocardia farcinica]MBA4855435.1 hypothetical protein [Nocardia farcinica]MBC9818226.1 hypothetical protein [Nocardia farcinica]MBF6067725.1 hypothetical protein [Nocardia farcinica]
MVDDVEKRWSDPEGFRKAVRFGLGVVALAALVAVIIGIWAASRDACETGPMLCDTASRVAMVVGPAVVLAAGWIGAFVITYLRWRQGRVWPIWQGTGWFLFFLLLAYLTIGGSVFAR